VAANLKKARKIAGFARQLYDETDYDCGGEVKKEETAVEN
jgi:hypothetical protein